MLKTQINSLPLFLFTRLLGIKEIVHFITTREGGVSPEPYNTLNLAFHTGDQPENVLKNRLILARALGIAPEDIVNGEQVHGANVAIVSEKGLTPAATDGMVTNKPGICLLVLVADCVPLIFYDPKNHAIGVGHAGWKGTVAGISPKIVQTLCQEFNSEPEQLIVAIGPSIGPCCYEVQDDVIKIVRQALPESQQLLHRHQDRWYLDLVKANEIQLLNAGVKQKNIQTANLCTRCHSETFYSARASRTPTGRFGVGIMLNP